MQLSSLNSSKTKTSETVFFFDTLSIQNNQISYLNNILAPLDVYFTYLRVGGGVPRGLGHNLLMQFSSLSGSKMEASEIVFFLIL